MKILGVGVLLSLIIVSSLLLAVAFTESTGGLSESTAINTTFTLLGKGSVLPDNGPTPARLGSWKGLLAADESTIHADATIYHKDGPMSGRFIFKKSEDGGWAIEEVDFTGADGSTWKQAVFQRETDVPQSHAMLCYAAMENNPKIADMALSKADTASLCTKPCEPYGEPAIALAGFRGNDDVLKRMIDRGMDVTRASSSKGLPLLHIVAGYGSPQMLKALIAAGADPNRRDPKGQSALDIAYTRKKLENAKLLTQLASRP